MYQLVPAPPPPHPSSIDDESGEGRANDEMMNKYSVVQPAVSHSLPPRLAFINFECHPVSTSPRAPFPMLISPSRHTPLSLTSALPSAFLSLSAQKDQLVGLLAGLIASQSAEAKVLIRE